MHSEAAGLMQHTIDALARMDASLLEELSVDAAELRGIEAEWEHEALLELRSLRQTLEELLRSTGGNIRVLSGLRRLEAGPEVVRWVR